ncbi:MAG TPA: enolase C-terminal domain-like protein [Alphaproteobacteria bacterium]
MTLPAPLAARLADQRPIVLARAEAMAVDLPLQTPINLSGRLKLATAEIVVVRIEAADGTTGWGECASAPAMTGDVIDGMLTAIDDFIAPVLIHRDLRRFDEAIEAVGRAVARNSAAKAAVDLALHDLVGKVLGVPVCEMLGGARRERVAAMWMLGNATVEGDVAEAAAKCRAGSHVFKLKVGTKAVEADIEAARGVRAAIGPDAILSVDANATWSEAQALRFAQATRDLALLNLEQPLPADDLDGMARIAAAAGAPVCADEGIRALADLDTHAARRAAQGASLKPLKLGGLAGARRAAERCAALGLKVNLADKVGESSLATAGLLQLAAAVPTLDWNVTPTNHYLADDIVPGGLAPRDGAFDILQTPGLGVTVDAAQIERYRRR